MKQYLFAFTLSSLLIFLLTGCDPSDTDQGSADQDSADQDSADQDIAIVYPSTVGAIKVEVNHAAILKTWDDEAYSRGKTIYETGRCAVIRCRHGRCALTGQRGR